LPGDSTFSIRKQCELLGVNRSGFYYVPSQKILMDAEVVEHVMARIDYWNTMMCYLGAKKIHNKLVVDDHIDISLDQVKTFMVQMGVCAVYPHQNTSKCDKKAAKPSYLLRGMDIWLPNMVWSVDITYIKLNRSHMYLTAIIDWFSRLLLNWELSDTLETAPVLDCVEGAFRKYGVPIIVNSDQGSQFTSTDYMDLLKDYRAKQSMDGKGRWVENRRIERWFRSLKVEDIYINEYLNPRGLRNGIGDYVEKYNTQRPHQSLGYQRPAVFHNSFFRI
jgi:putative transposase